MFEYLSKPPPLVLSTMPRTTQSPYVFNLPDVRGLRDAGCMGFHRSPVRKISFSPDGMYVVTGDDQGYLVVRSALNIVCLISDCLR
jgi:hypothetical protein